MFRALRTLTLLALLTGVASAAASDSYREARAELIAAYQAQDYAAMVAAADKALRARPGYPAARFNLALAYVLNGEAGAALEELESLLAAGIDFGVSDLDEFASVRTLPGWDRYEQGIRALREPTGETLVALERDDDRFVPEGIAVDAEGKILLGSIRDGKIVRGEDVLSRRQGHWSVFGMRFHDDGSLWFASAAVPQLDNVGEERGRTGLFRLDPASGNITRSAVLPQQAEEQVLGDLVISGDTIYTTDSLTGAVYRYDIVADAFTTLVEAGTFGSPQGLVLDPSARHLYVADYIGGLYRVAVQDGRAERMVVEVPVSDYGIDGLYRHRDRLIAIQNGIQPHRVTALQLSPDGKAIIDSRVLAANLPAFDEPTLGVVHGDDFYFVANSHWNRFDRDNRLPDGLAGPIVLKLSLVD
jgi:sugar lactone lactonase YvrE